MPQLSAPPGGGTGAVELWNGYGRIVWIELCIQRTGALAGRQRKQCAAALTRVVLREGRQTRSGRCEIEVAAVLCRYCVGFCHGGQRVKKRMALAMDATQLKDFLTVLVVSVVYRGCAIPIAWRVLPKTEKGSWKQPWLDLFSGFQRGDS